MIFLKRFRIYIKIKDKKISIRITFFKQNALAENLEGKTNDKISVFPGRIRQA